MCPRSSTTTSARTPILPNVETFLCREPVQLQPRAGQPRQAGGQGGGRIGRLRHAGRPARARPSSATSSREAHQGRPGATTSPSRPSSCRRAPCLVDGRIEPRHVDLRPFILSGEKVMIVPGALTRVALKRGSLVVNSRRAAGGRIPGCCSNSRVQKDKDKGRDRRQRQKTKGEWCRFGSSRNCRRGGRRRMWRCGSSTGSSAGYSRGIRGCAISSSERRCRSRIISPRDTSGGRTRSC